VSGRRKKEEGRRKKEEGRRKKEEGRRKKEEKLSDFFLSSQLPNPRYQALPGNAYPEAQPHISLSRFRRVKA
jgi:hypothetical protein